MWVWGWGVLPACFFMKTEKLLRCWPKARFAHSHSNISCLALSEGRGAQRYMAEEGKKRARERDLQCWSAKRAEAYWLVVFSTFLCFCSWSSSVYSSFTFLFTQTCTTPLHSHLYDYINIENIIMCVLKLAAPYGNILVLSFLSVSRQFFSCPEARLFLKATCFYYCIDLCVCCVTEDICLSVCVSVSLLGCVVVLHGVPVLEKYRGTLTLKTIRFCICLVPVLH